MWKLYGHQHLGDAVDNNWRMVVQWSSNNTLDDKVRLTTYLPWPIISVANAKHGQCCEGSEEVNIRK
jgi:hypothetical protein